MDHDVKAGNNVIAARQGPQVRGAEGGGSFWWGCPLLLNSFLVTTLAFIGHTGGYVTGADMRTLQKDVDNHKETLEEP